MKEVKRIAKLFDDLYQGSPWIDVNLIHTLNGIDAATAFAKVLPHWNSIWEIVNHLINWRLTVLQRVRGEVLSSPADNYFTPVTDNSAEAWELTLQRLRDSQDQWMKALARFKRKELETEYAGNGMTYYENIQGIIQHDAYHLGQIVLLAKQPST